MSSSERNRHFAFILYPEDLIDYWQDIISDWHVDAYLSPLHDKDYNPDGELKKAHYHLMLMFDGMKNYDTQVAPLIAQLRKDGFVTSHREVINSCVGYARYLIHKDNPEKYQYSVKDVISFGGAEPYQHFIEKSADKDVAIRKIYDIIRSEGIMYYNDLINYLIDSESDLLYYLNSGVSFSVVNYLKAQSAQAQSRG